jgi:hypothetical protein
MQQSEDPLAAVSELLEGFLHQHNPLKSGGTPKYYNQQQAGLICALFHPPQEGAPISVELIWGQSTRSFAIAFLSQSMKTPKVRLIIQVCLYLLTLYKVLFPEMPPDGKVLTGSQHFSFGFDT